MFGKNENPEMDVVRLAEENFVDSPSSVGGCNCMDQHRMNVALSEQRGRQSIFSPDHSGIKGAYCATHGRCRVSS